MPTLFTEGATTGSFIYSEANATRSRENVQVAPGTAVRVATLAARRSGDALYRNYNPAAGDGTETLRGLFYDTYDVDDNAGLQTGTPVVRGVIVARDAEVNREEIDWNGLTSGQITTAIASLASLGIIVREGV